MNRELVVPALVLASVLMTSTATTAPRTRCRASRWRCFLAATFGLVLYGP